MDVKQHSTKVVQSVPLAMVSCGLAPLVPQCPKAALEERAGRKHHLVTVRRVPPFAISPVIVRQAANQSGGFKTVTGHCDC